MKKIAIKGHPTRGEDIIKILESLGGINKLHLQGNQCAGCYYIENDNSINCKSHYYIVNEYDCYTLEEYEQKFLKTMKKIAIQGHPTRNNDIIKILESLGGINGKDYLGNDTYFYYYINTKNFIDCEPDGDLPQEYKKYSLEEYEQTCNTMKNIAILGHLTRSKDIIKILESLGGVNIQNYKCNSTNLYYYVNDANYIDCHSWTCLNKKYKTYTLEEYEQIQKDMEKRNIQIDLATAREWYKQGRDLRKVALQAFSEEELQTLPKSWEEYCGINPYLTKNKEFFLAPDGTITNIPHQYCRRVDFTLAMSSKKRAEQFVVLSKLLQIRDYYNQGWEPDWTDDREEKYVISINGYILCRSVSWFTNRIFTFKTQELRDEFFNNFKEDLEFIKEFL